VLLGELAALKCSSGFHNGAVAGDLSPGNNIARPSFIIGKKPREQVARHVTPGLRRDSRLRAVKGRAPALLYSA